MGTFVIETNKATLFPPTGDFYGTLQITATRDQIKNKFTVKVTGVRSYCKFRWNFNQNIKIGLGTSKDTAKENAKSFLIKSFNVHPDGGIVGWGPASGYLTKDSNNKAFNTVSLTVNGTSDKGNCGPLYVYFNIYNAGVTHNTTGKETTLNITSHKSISADTQKAAGGANDVTAPVVSGGVSSLASGAATIWAGAGSSTIDRYSYKVGSGDWKSFYSDDSGTTSSKTTTLYLSNSPTEYSVTVKGRKKSNHLWDESSSFTVDLRPVTITLSIDEVSGRRVVIKASSGGWWVSNYQYSLDGGSWKSFGSKTSTQDDQVIVLANVDYSTHYIKVRATRDHNKIVTTTKDFVFDTRRPTFVSTPELAIHNNGDGAIWFTPSSNCNVYINGNRKSYAQGGKATSVSVKLHNKENDTYVVRIERSDNSSLASEFSVVEDTRIPTISDFEMFAISSSEGRVKFQSPYDVNYEVKKVNSRDILCSGSSLSNIIEKKDFNIGKKEVAEYELKVSRSSKGKSNLTATNKSLVDTREPGLRIESFSVKGLTVHVKCGTKLDCDAWVCEVYREEDNKLVKVDANSTNACNSFEFNINLSGEEISAATGKLLFVSVTAIRYNSMVTQTVNNRGKSQICGGTVWLYSKGSYKRALPYIYHKGKWMAAPCYVYKENKGWIICGGT